MDIKLREISSGCYVPKSGNCAPIFEGKVFDGSNQYEIIIQRSPIHDDIVETIINWEKHLIHPEIARIATAILRKISVLSYLATGYPFDFTHISTNEDNKRISYVYERGLPFKKMMPYKDDNLLNLRLKKWIPFFNDESNHNMYDNQKEKVFNVLLTEFAHDYKLTFIAHILFLLNDKVSNISKDTSNSQKKDVPISDKHNDDFKNIIGAFRRVRNCAVHPDGIRCKCPLFEDYGTGIKFYDCLYDASEHMIDKRKKSALKQKEQCHKYVYLPAKTEIGKKDRETIYPSVILLRKIKFVTRAHMLHNYFNLWENDDTGLQKEFEDTLFGDIQSS